MTSFCGVLDRRSQARAGRRTFACCSEDTVPHFHCTPHVIVPGFVKQTFPHSTLGNSSNGQNPTLQTGCQLRSKNSTLTFQILFFSLSLRFQTNFSSLNASSILVSPWIPLCFNLSPPTSVISFVLQRLGKAAGNFFPPCLLCRFFPSLLTK